MSAGLSVAHLGPRSSLGYVLLINWLTRAGLGWLVALPVITAVGASGLDALPQADRALFEAGGLWLVELLYREAHALSAGLRAALFLALGALVLRTPITALLFTATQDPEATLSVAFRRALGHFRRFFALSVLEWVGRGIVVVFALLAARALDSLAPHAANEALRDLTPVLGYLLGLALAAALAVFWECCRAFSVIAPKHPFRAVLAAASSAARAHGLELFASFVLYVGVGAFVLACGARLVEGLDVGRAGALRVVGVCLVHQIALLALCLFQGIWVQRVVTRVQPGPVSPSALR